MPAQPRLMFTNIATSDLPAAKTFFAAIGFEFNPKFTDENCACMVVSEQAFVMLLAKARFADFTKKDVVDSHVANEALLCVSAESREDVDAFADAALAAGGTPANDPQDYGFMYGRSFYDLDGHQWEVMWMDPVAVEQGPADMAGATA